MTPEQSETNSPLWEVFLIDGDGFVIEDPEAVLASIDDYESDADAPDVITVCRKEAKPQPQYPGSEFLRMPGSRYTVDCIDIDVSTEEDPERAMILWTAATGAALALNKADRDDAPEED